jgi:hypothetical protein
VRACVGDDDNQAYGRSHGLSTQNAPCSNFALQSATSLVLLWAEWTTPPVGERFRRVHGDLGGVAIAASRDSGRGLEGSHGREAVPH